MGYCFAALGTELFPEDILRRNAIGYCQVAARNTQVSEFYPENILSNPVDTYLFRCTLIYHTTILLRHFDLSDHFIVSKPYELPLIFYDESAILSSERESR